MSLASSEHPLSEPVSLQPSAQPVEGYWTRDHALVMVLVAVTVLLCYLCYLLVKPFLAALAWAVAIAVVAHPVHGWIEKRIHKPSLAAGISVVLIVVVLVTPTVFVLHQVGLEATKAIQSLQDGQVMEKWGAILDRFPQLAPLRQWGNPQLGVGQWLENSLAWIQSIVTGSIGAIVGLLVTFFFLFFLFRDRRQALGALRSLVPLSERETDEVFARVGDTIYATIYGTFAVAAVQGALGGLMFWWLGLPAPLLWGIVMGLLAIIPVLGAFVVWVPAAIFLAFSGEWGKALLLTLWGSVVVGLIDNLLYPVIVGNRLRMHTAPVFVSIVGGLNVFGASGLVLGPVILAITQALIDIWRRRTRGGRPAEAAVAQPRIAQATS